MIVNEEQLDHWLTKEALYVDTHDWSVDKCGNSEGMNVYILDNEHENPDYYGVYFHNNGEHESRPTRRYDEEKGYIDDEYEIFKLNRTTKFIEISDYEIIDEETI